jgi:hypothetical protein
VSTIASKSGQTFFRASTLTPIGDRILAERNCRVHSGPFF